MGIKELNALLTAAGAADAGSEARVKKRILIVDDDRAVRDSLHFALRRDFDVVLAASAEEGVAAMTEDIMVVVLDVKMQGKNGFWAAARIQEGFPLTPLIFHSAYQDAKNPIDIINEHRPFAYVTKGAGTDKLIDAIHRAVKYVDVVRDNHSVVARLSTIQTKMKEIGKARSEGS